MTQPHTELLEVAPSPDPEAAATAPGRSPWALAWRRLRRNRLALAAFGVFLVVLALCASAPLFASRVAHTGPNENHIVEQVRVGGRARDVVSLSGVPIGPTWWHAGGRFVLGADQNGRDVAVRLLYGGVTSLEVGLGSALLCVAAALVLALLAAYYRGPVDWIVSRFFDLVWAVPVILLAIALGTALAVNGFHHFGLDISGGSLWIPTLVISYVYIPYVGRPLRSQLLSLREKEFVEAAVVEGAGPVRVMVSELLPNVASTALVFFTLIIANNILLEAALSFLGAGVQPPNPSWGTLIAEGQDRIVTAPWLTLVPGLAIVLTVLSLNVFGDGLRDALDPRATTEAA